MIRERHLLDVATEYRRQGWMCIPIPFREKNPGFTGWEDWRLDTPEKLARHFNGREQNIGVLLGPPSNHIVDVDLDFTECLPFARIFLPDTRQFGRRTNPVSHWLYTVNDAPNRTVFVSDRMTEDGKKRETVLEIRGNRHQSVFPASTHKDTGEPILWVGQQPPYEITFADLHKQCGRVAAGAVLARYWPRTKGNRHECALALAGLLLRAGLTVEEAERFIGAIAKIAGNDGEIHTNTVKATKTTMDAGKKVTGWKCLSELLNAGLAIAKVPEWLGYIGQNTEEQPEPSNDAVDENPEEEKPKSKPAATLKNAVRAILSNPELTTIIWYNDFLRRPMTGDPPREWTDTDDLELTIKLQSIRGFTRRFLPHSPNHPR